MGRLVLARGLGEEIIIGDNIIVKVCSFRNGVVKIGIEAPNDIPVDRRELRQRKDAEKVK